MVYECTTCQTPLPPGTVACCNCGEAFDEAVPQDAEVPKRGWQPATKTPAPSVTNEDAASSADAAAASGRSHKNAVPENAVPENAVHRSPGLSETRNFPNPGSTLPGAQLSKYLANRRLLVAAGIGILVVCAMIALVRPRTNEYVFQQHPLYQANMASLGDRLKSAGSDFTWPYEGHEDRLYCALHSNGSAGGDSSAPLPQNVLNFMTSAIRLQFCSIRYQSGFSPEEAVQCQVYVLSNNGTDKGYDGPGASPANDEVIKASLTNGSLGNAR